MKQVIVIHGGDAFETYEDYLNFISEIEFDFSRTLVKGWKDNLQSDLGGDFQVIKPSMPNKWNARYLEWKIWFEKTIPFMEEELVLVGHSLGGTFLAKYLAENKLSKILKGIFLVAGVFDEEGVDDKLMDFALPESLEKVSEQGPIYLYHSTDDDIVLHHNVEKFKTAFPKAQLREFSDKGHFNGEHFPELVDDIKEAFSS